GRVEFGKTRWTDARGGGDGVAGAAQETGRREVIGDTFNCKISSACLAFLKLKCLKFLWSLDVGIWSFFAQALHVISASFFKSTRLIHCCNSFGSWPVNSTCTK